MSFYGNLVESQRSLFHFDKVYANRKNMEEHAATDGVYVGRYALIQYTRNADDTPAEDFEHEKLNFDANAAADKEEYEYTFDATVWVKTFDKYCLVCSLDSTGIIRTEDFIYNEEGFSLPNHYFNLEPVEGDGISTILDKTYAELPLLKLKIQMNILGKSMSDLIDILLGGRDATPSAPGDTYIERKGYNIYNNELYREGWKNKGLIDVVYRWDHAIGLEGPDDKGGILQQFDTLSREIDARMAAIEYKWDHEKDPEDPDDKGGIVQQFEDLSQDIESRMAAIEQDWNTLKGQIEAWKAGIQAEWDGLKSDIEDWWDTLEEEWQGIKTEWSHEASGTDPGGIVQQFDSLKTDIDNRMQSIEYQWSHEPVGGSDEGGLVQQFNSLKNNIENSFNELETTFEGKFQALSTDLENQMDIIKKEWDHPASDSDPGGLKQQVQKAIENILSDIKLIDAGTASTVLEGVEINDVE